MLVTSVSYWQRPLNLAVNSVYGWRQSINLTLHQYLSYFGEARAVFCADFGLTHLIAMKENCNYELKSHGNEAQLYIFWQS